jgi:hypothetical protein
LAAGERHGCRMHRLNPQPRPPALAADHKERPKELVSIPRSQTETAFTPCRMAFAGSAGASTRCGAESDIQAASFSPSIRNLANALARIQALMLVISRAAARLILACSHSGTGVYKCLSYVITSEGCFGISFILIFRCTGYGPGAGGR